MANTAFRVLKNNNTPYYIQIKGRYFYLLLFCFLSSTLFGQNLINDPSFEEMSCSGSGFRKSPNWFFFQGGDCKIANECNVDEKRRPSSFSVDRKVLFGQAIAWTYVMDNQDYGKNFRTPIAKLSDTLEKGFVYGLSFYVSFSGHGNDLLAIEEYGAKFMDYFPDTNVAVLDQPFFGTHDVENTNGILEDSKGWTKIKGLYKSNGNEHVIVFGRLIPFPDVTSKELGTGDFLESWYFVDGFTLIPFPELLVHDTTICEGDTLRIAPKVPDNAFYEWSTGQKGGVLEITQPGTYYVSNYSAFDTISDSIVVKVVPKEPQLPSLLACGESSAEADLSSSNALSIEWFDGDDAFVRSFSTSGSYAYTLQIADCEVEDVLSVTIVPTPDPLPNPIDWCSSKELWLKGGTKDYDYILWNGNEADSLQISAELSNIERVVHQQGCVFTESSEVQQWQDLRFADIDTSLCPGSRLELQFDTLPVAYQSKQSLIITDTGLYQLYYYNGCDTQLLRIRVREHLDCACPVYQPNAFSPNGDGSNDTFQLFTDCQIEEQHFQLYNRWGQLLYSSTTWPGIAQEANNYPVGAYYFIWTAVLNNQGQTHLVNRSGFVHLMK